MKLVCEVEGCDEELTEGTGSKGGPMLCKWCKSPRTYWGKKTLPEMRARYNRLDLFRHRMEYYDSRVNQIVNAAKKSVNASKQRAHDANTAAKSN